ncbi:MAG: hypothetical protein GY795_20415 [Desulfobacterales bacterium]|nr:hypothetical protein [Desulfobacterales bacterium]
MYYYLYDANGNVGQLANAADGSIAAHYEYDPFGNIIKAEGEYRDRNPYRFSTKYIDSETGLIYYGYRYLSADIGRWLSRDPIGEQGGITLYLFVRNNPINETDPYGLEVLTPDTVMSMIATDIVPISIDEIQLFLEVVGTFDPTIAADLVNAIIYASRGEHSDSLLSLGAMIPYLGDLICKGGKMAKKAEKVKDFIERIAPCFVAGTLIHTIEGLQPIEDIRPGDIVLSKDEETGETGWRRVTKISVTPEQPIFELTVEGENGSFEKLDTTGEHPFWLKNQGWTDAIDLLPGDEIFSSKGGWLRVAGATWLSEHQTVYNFKVEDFHSYFVGNLGAWVHNGLGKHCTYKAVNLPSWKKIGIDMEEVISGHTVSGSRAVQSGIKDSFPEYMSPKQIEKAVR